MLNFYWYLSCIHCSSDKPVWQSPFLSDNGAEWKQPWCLSSQ